MLALYTRIRYCLDDESGQTVVEYCLMIGLIGLALAATTPTIVESVITFFGKVSTVLAGLGPQG